MEKLKHKMSVSTAKKVFIIALLLMFASSIFASMLQTDFGKVEVVDFKIPTNEGRYISGHLFVPKTASSENKVPLVITCAGQLNNEEMQDSTCVELSRRGIAVIAYDPYFHGDSSGAGMHFLDSVKTEGMGMVEMVEYASTLDYVDTSMLGIYGHSMGGRNVWFTAEYYGLLYEEAMAEATAADSEDGEKISAAEQEVIDGTCKVTAALSASMLLDCNEEFLSHIHCNFGSNFSYFDEGAFRLINGTGDMATCQEAAWIVNSVLPAEEQVEFAEVGKYYGDMDANTLRVIFNPVETHALQHFSPTSTGYVIDFFEECFGLDKVIPSSNQVWLVKELFNALGLVGIILSIIPMFVLLLEVPCFASLKGEVPAALPAPKKTKGKLVFWGGWAISWIISGTLMITVGGWDKIFFPTALSHGITNWFPQYATNFLVVWAVFNGLVGLLLFWLSYRFYGKKNGVTPEMFGLKIGWKELLKTLALAVCVFVGFFCFVSISEYFFDTDFRLWVIAVCTFSHEKLLVALEYFPLFFVFYFASALATNGSYRIETKSEGWNLFICALGNILGIVYVLVVQYATLFATGYVKWQGAWQRPLIVIPLVVFLFASTYVNRYSFKATGKVWLGAFINCLIIVMIGVANTASYLPIF